MPTMMQGMLPTRHLRDHTMKRCPAKPGSHAATLSSVFLPFGRRTTTGMLAGMTLLVLLMPMNYRAGTETDHPHAFFQELIDVITGTPHEHGAEVGEAHRHASGDGDHSHVSATTATATISPFLAADIPLTAAAEAAHAAGPSHAGVLPASNERGARLPASLPAGIVGSDADRDTVVASFSPDVPGVTDLTPAAEKGSAILVLTTLLATILVAESRRRELWTHVDRLRAVADRVESPPPRPASC
ncbi:MAG: hypothetical protein QM589_00875 [Thermomicrobiales bacterium]